MTNFNKEQTIIMNITSKYGCMSMQQIYDLIPEHSHKSLQMLVTQLVKGRYLDIVDDQFVVINGYKDRFKRKASDMLWAIIRLTNGNVEEIMDSLNAAAPVEYLLTVHNTKTYKLLTPNESKLVLLQELIEENHKKALAKKKSQTTKYKVQFNFESYYALVVTSKEMMSILKEYNFPVPIYVIYLEYISPYKPQIKCLKKSPKNETECE